ALILILIVHVSLPKLWDMTLCLVRLSVNIGRSSSFLSQICLVELHEHETHVLEPSFPREVARHSYRRNVRFGSLADIRSRMPSVRFTPKSGHAQPQASMSVKCQ